MPGWEGGGPPEGLCLPVSWGAPHPISLGTLPWAYRHPSHSLYLPFLRALGRRDCRIGMISRGTYSTCLGGVSPGFDPSIPHSVYTS